MAHLQFFPEEINQMQEEISKHPDVLEVLGKTQSQYFEDRLAAVCTHLNILVDGEYDIDEISGLCELITKKLYEKRTGLWITH